MKTTLDENPDSESGSGGGLCVHEGWLGLKPADYSGAVIRLATLAQDRNSFLVFGWVELLPNEINAPPDAGRYRNFGSARYIFSRSALPLSEGLAWYHAASGGNFTVPKTSCTFAASRLAPEPHAQRFVARNDVPFSPEWHVTPRIHRLVPMDDPQGPLADLVSKMVDVNRFKEARQWLEEQLHFDVCAHDDWLGSLALVAPNPLLRSSRHHIRASDASGETVQVSTRLRSGVDHSSLSVRFQEHRAGADGWTHTCKIDSLGSAQMQAPGSVDALEYQIICSERGLLNFQPPANWVRAIRTEIGVQSGKRTVPVPARRKGDSPQSYSTPILSRAALTTIGTAPDDGLSRLKTLQDRREARTGARRPLGSGYLTQEVRIFHKDRAAAADFIREQIGRARSRLVFVDPYFNPIDFTEFALAAAWPDVAVKILINPAIKQLSAVPISAPPGITRQGDWFVHLIELVRDKAKELRTGGVEVFVSHPDCRFHDRVLIVDDDLWLCGHSFNNVGTGEISTMVRLPKSDDLRKRITDAFGLARPFIEFWAESTEPISLAVRGCIKVAGFLRQLAEKLERPAARFARPRAPTGSPQP
jgi:hypothetical protein